MARRHFSNEADVEDAVQDIFISLWKSAHRFDPARAKESTFVSMVARRRLIDRIRSSQTQEARAEIVELSEVPLPSPARLEENQDAQRAAKALESLPEERRKVLWLSIHQGLSHREIAEKTGLPVGTVKSHFRRGLTAVRQMLSEPKVQAGEVLS